MIGGGGEGEEPKCHFPSSKEITADKPKEWQCEAAKSGKPRHKEMFEQKEASSDNQEVLCTSWKGSDATGLITKSTDYTNRTYSRIIESS